MGAKDTITKEYMSRPEYFADAFNYFMFNGKQVIKQEKLEVLDSTEIGIVFANEETDVIQKFRDVLKQCVLMEDDKLHYLILGIENQSDIHYAMPVKNMIYDALNYGNQVVNIARKHKRSKDLHGDEFLSGFSKSDKIKPVITLVVYFGAKEWDAPRAIKDMFDDISDEILKYVTDYKTNLIIPKEIDDFSKFKTELGKALMYISVSNEDDKYKDILNNEKYRFISKSTAQLLNACVGYEISIDEKKEEIDMCEVTKHLKTEGKMEMLFELVSNGELEIAVAAKRASLSEEEFKKIMNEKNKNS